MAMLWMLAYSDGEHSTLDVAEVSGVTFGEVDDAARVLREAGLLRAE